MSTSSSSSSSSLSLSSLSLSSLPPPSSDLPRDVLIDILSRLPVRSILRFKSVSKSWYSLFHSPTFISKHLLHLNNTTTYGTATSKFIYTPRLPPSAPPPNTQSITLLSESHSFTIPIAINIPFLSISKPLRVSGSCNGLVCLSILPLASIILLWNPATRVFKNIPNSTVSRPQTLPIKVVLGFGLDPRAPDDYKLLRIVYYCYPLKQVEVYSLKTDSWREITTDLRFLIFESSCSVVVAGRFHWRAIRFGDSNGKEVIISFDMDDEVFRYIALPDLEGNSDEEKCSWRLVKLGDCLGVVGWVENGANKMFDVWVMERYGAESSWTKRYSFGPFLRNCRLLGCGRNGEVLLESSEMLMYDPKSDTTKKLGADGVECWSDVFVHEESLVPIKGGEVAERIDFSVVGPDLFFVRKFDLMLDE